uniref:Cadherin domain protein n=1 Tax=Trichuris muris TaxID=70415 RepID=A0A5S6QZT1_TRIMR
MRASGRTILWDQFTTLLVRNGSLYFKKPMCLNKPFEGSVSGVMSEVFTTGRLDREQVDRHMLRVTCTDASQPKQGAVAIVIVRVIDVNDHNPIFEQSNYATLVSEAIEPGTSVLHVHAHDEDIGPNGQVQYHIAPGQADCTSSELPFTLGIDDGVLRIQKSLDRETCAFYRLEVSACDRSLPISSRRCTKALVEVTIEDENDNVPQFELGNYYVEINEDVNFKNRPVIVQIVATDRDVGENGQVRYSIVSGNGDLRFSIDYVTGEVRVVDKLDYRQKNHYELLIRAQDGGHHSHSNTTLLGIRILDVNDHPPRFYATLFQESVKEDVPVGHRVLRLIAHDPDSGCNADIRYSILSVSNVRTLPLQLDEVTGWLSVSKPLDHEVMPKIEFTVQARDMGQPPLQSTARVVVHVLDVNDNPPMFLEKFVNVSIEETSPRGTQLLQIKAYDPDGSDSRLDYSIVSGNDDRMFILLNDEDNQCTLAVDQPLDYRAKAMYWLGLKVTDSGGNSDTMTVQVQVLDVNSPPVFPEQAISVHISEAESAGSVVAVVRAVDMDDGENARLNYTLQIDNEYFSIDHETGVISTMRSLDRESVSKFDLMISATDNGDPPLSCQIAVEIIVEDVNDNAPHFMEPIYYISTSEDTPVGASLIQLAAVDADYGLNSRIAYHLSAEGNERNTFNIDVNSGVIRLAHTLDREAVAAYNLTAMAVDKGQPPLLGQANVIVTVTDVNDNPPRFQQDQYKFDVKENSPRGTVIGRLLAEDPDEAENAVVVYKIFGGEDAVSFEIRSSEASALGVDVLTRTDLDFESDQRTYHFYVQASSGELSSITEVIVRVLDVNDHEPVLSDFNVVIFHYRAVNQWSQTKSNGLIGRVPAFDLDVNDTLEYWIISGNEAELIWLDESNGNLHLTSASNTNRPIRLSMKILVSDGSNRVEATCTVIVETITDKILLNSVTLRATGVTVEALLTPLAYGRLVDAIATLLPSNPRDVLLFSIKQDGEIGMEPIVNVSLALRKAGSDLAVSGEELYSLISLNRRNLSAALHFPVAPLEENFCVREPCINYEACRSVLKFSGPSNMVVTESFMLRPIHTVTTFLCECPKGFSGLRHRSECNIEVDMCFSSPCRSGGTCLSTENDYFCQCPEDFTGKNCEIPIANSYCIPFLCRGGSSCEIVSGRQECKRCPHPAPWYTRFCQLTARTFNGDSYVQFPALHQRSRFNVTFRFSTNRLDGLLLYAGCNNVEMDFIGLELKEGRLKASFSLGKKEIHSVVLNSEQTLNDGDWHKVELHLLNQTMTIAVDDCDLFFAFHRKRKLLYPQCAASVHAKLEKKCDDGTISCFRFLDLSSPLYIGGLPQRNKQKRFRLPSPGFVGCISDLYIDHSLIDMDRHLDNYMTIAGCSAMSMHCQDKPCRNEATCNNRLNTYSCDCAVNFSGRNCSYGVDKTTNLAKFSSFVSYNLSERVTVPFTFGVDFRTNQRDVHILTAELQNGQQIVLSIIGELAGITVASVQHVLPQRLDYIYQKNVIVRNRLVGDLKMLSSGLSPDGVAYSATKFRGCLKGAFASSRSDNVTKYLKILQQKDSSDVCDYKIDSCRMIDKHQQCIDMCSFEPCLNGGTCVPHPSGYRCSCKEHYTGRNCQLYTPMVGGKCPEGWWGLSACGPCSCDIDAGYGSNCDMETGICGCKNGTYMDTRSGHCLSCDCNFPTGALNSSCDPITGQCYCRGDVIGRRCDTCQNQRAQISQTRGHCEIAKNGCPEAWEAKLLWPSIAKGAVESRACPKGWHGRAVRKCGANGIWEAPQLENCVKEELEMLEDKIYLLNSSRRSASTAATVTWMAEKLKNSTQHQLLYGSDVLKVTNIVSHILNAELEKYNSPSAYQQDRHFLSNIIASLDEAFSPEQQKNMGILDEQLGVQKLKLILRLHDYGFRVASYQQKSKSDPIHYNGKNIVYSVEHVNNVAGRNMQKVLTLGNSKRIVVVDFEITPEMRGNSDAGLFFAAYDGTYEGPLAWDLRNSSLRRARRSVDISSPLLSVGLVNDDGMSIDRIRKPVVIAFPLDLKLSNAYLFPTCIFMVSDSVVESDPVFHWSSDGCHVGNYNATHVMCHCRHFSTFAISMQDLMSLNLNLARVSITVTTLCYLLIAAAVALRLALRKQLWSSEDVTVLPLMIYYVLTLTFFELLVRTVDTPLKCAIFGNALLFLNVALFVWMVLIPIKIYKMRTLADGQCPFRSWILHVFVIAIALVYVGVKVLVALLTKNDESCWLHFRDANLVFIAAPFFILMLLAVYVCAVGIYLDYMNQRKAFSRNERRKIGCILVLESLMIAQWLLAFTAFNHAMYSLYYAYYAIGLLTSLLFSLLIYSAILLNGKTYSKANTCETECAKDTDLWISMNASQFEMSMKPFADDSLVVNDREDVTEKDSLALPEDENCQGTPTLDIEHSRKALCIKHIGCDKDRPIALIAGRNRRELTTPSSDKSDRSRVPQNFSNVILKKDSSRKLHDDLEKQLVTVSVSDIRSFWFGRRS